MPNSSHNQLYEQLTAFLDGELGPDERLLVETHLAENPELAQRLEQWRENGDALRSLPRHRLDDTFAARVLANLEANLDSAPSQNSLPESAPQSRPNLQQNLPPTSPAHRGPIARRRQVNWIAWASIAALLVVVFSVFLIPKNPDPIANNSDDNNAETESEFASNSNDLNQNNPDEADSPNATPKHQIVRPSMAMALNPANSGEIESDGHPKIIQQVLLVTLSDSHPNLDDVAQVLRDHDIQIVHSDNAKTEEKRRAEIEQLRQSLTQLNASDKSILVLATMPQMAEIVRELSTTTQATIDPVTVTMADLEDLKRLPGLTNRKPNTPQTSPFLLWIRQ